MASALCIQCSSEFPSEEVFQEHKKSGHTTAGIPLAAPDDPNAPTQEFIEAVARIEGKKKEAEAPPPAPDRPVVPVKLTYVYTGNCPLDNIPVKTLELDVKDSHFVIAYCQQCNKQLESREEKDLNGPNRESN